MVMQGADTDQLRALARSLEQAGRTLDQIGVGLNAQLRSTRWEGSDAGQFLGVWSSRHLPSLRHVAAGLSAAGSTVLANATEQDNASNAGTTGTGGRWTSSTQVGSATRNGIVERISEGSWSLLGVLSSAGDVAEFVGSSLAPRALIAGPAGALLGFRSAWDGFSAALEGDVDTAIRSSTDLGWTAAGIGFPPVRAIKGSWDLGWAIGDGVYAVGDHFGINDAVQNTIINDVIAREYDGQITDDLGTRYDGFSGFGRFVSDSAQSGLSRLKFW